MYDGPKIITGIVIFLVIVTFPIWYNVASGKADYQPDPKLPATEKSCVMDTAYMKANHMDLLNTWRDEVVRNGERVFTAQDGRKYNKSLTGNCLGCHESKADFCDQCHNYVGVAPYCWNCHVDPEKDMK